MRRGWFALALCCAFNSPSLRAQTATLSDAAANARPLAAATGTALIRSATEFESASRFDEARLAYLGAIPSALPIADWLRLRAAGLTADSSERQLLYRQIKSTTALEQVTNTELAARERFGDLDGAVRLASEAGLTAQFFRLRLAHAGAAGSRAEIRKQILALDPARQLAFAGPDGQAILDLAVPKPTPVEALTLARFATTAADAKIAIPLYAEAFAGRQGTPADRLEYGKLLFRAGRYADVVSQLSRVTAPAALASQAALLRGWAQLRAGDDAGSQKTLELLGRRYPHDSAAVGSSLFLLADIAREQGHYDRARRLWLRLAEQYPSNARAGRSRMLAALVLWTEQRPREAALEWEKAIARAGRNEEKAAPAYWAGRAWSAAGDTARAWRRWQEAVASDPLSWYARESARRLGTAGWVPAAAPDSFASNPAIESTRERIALLDQAGLADAARLEAQGIAGGKDRPAEFLLSAAAALRAEGWPSYAIQLGWRAIKSGAPTDARTYRLVFPALYADSLSAEARRNKVDPALVAGLIRQESMFDSRALSRAGARGLMQLMPEVARPAAQAAGIEAWNDDLLNDPSLNLKLGVQHLAGLLKDYDDLPRVLAAYNAGRRRADQWSGYPGAKDPEVFTEWIPFDETRGYIMAIQRNVELYRALYLWPG